MIPLFAIACGGSGGGEGGDDQKGDCTIDCNLLGVPVETTASITKGECIAAGKIADCEATYCPPGVEGECEKVYPEEE
jgi:hypothetical protein